MHAELFVILGIYFVIYLVTYLAMKTPARADPWDIEITKAVEDPQALPLCHRCFTPQDHLGWFCPVCGAAVGRYNNWMPYVNVFSEGEVLRAGTKDHIRPSLLVIADYLLYSLAAYFVFAPMYWYFLFRNMRKRQREVSVENEDLV
jgi:hypothetical protein